MTNVSSKMIAQGIQYSLNISSCGEPFETKTSLTVR